ncbi:MAG: nucleotidyltransferase domain-containing protein [Anaerolineae bacterium]
MDIQAYQSQLERLFIEHGVVLAYLFGSQAEGRAGPLSDLDFAVLLGDDLPSERHTDIQIDLIGDLMRLFHRHDVDVVILNRATPLLAHQVVKHGKVIYEDEVTRPAVDFAVHAISRYADTEPLRRLAQRYLEEWIEERRKARMEKPSVPHRW